MSATVQEEKFGCARCWPAAAEAAWEARGTLKNVADLIDESHFHVMILACQACSQRFVSVFTETIDWADGDDPQYWQVLPLTGPEAAALLARADSLKETELETLAPGRRCLRRDHPKGAPSRTSWGAGMFAALHD